VAHWEQLADDTKPYPANAHLQTAMPLGPENCAVAPVELSRSLSTPFPATRLIVPDGYATFCILPAELQTTKT